MIAPDQIGWVIAFAICLPVAFWSGCAVGLLLAETRALHLDPFDVWFPS